MSARQLKEDPKGGENVGTFEDERGISNLVATLILIAVAVVGGAFAYTAFRDQAGSSTSSADLQVQGLDAVETGDNDVYLSATVKNVGTELLEGVTVTVKDGDDNIEVMSGVDLDPGQTDSSSKTDGSGDLTPGETYPVEITANTPDGGSVTKTMTVRVKS